MSLFVFFISLLIVAQHVSGNHVPIISSWRLRDVIVSCWTWQPSRSHGTYQHETITSRSRQLLMMGTWLPETCWATIRGEIKNTKLTSSWFSLSTLNYQNIRRHFKQRLLMLLAAKLTSHNSDKTACYLVRLEWSLNVASNNALQHIDFGHAHH